MMVTDDSFQFAKAAKRVSDRTSDMGEYFDSLKVKSGFEGDGPSETIEEDDPLWVARKQVLVNAMEAAYELYKFQWAKTPVDTIFRIAAHWRLFFPPHLRAKIDKWNTTIAARRGATSFTGGKAIASHNDHPLRVFKNR